MPDWKTNLCKLLLDAELAQKYYLRAHEAHQDWTMKFALALRNLQEHAGRKPRRAEIEPYYEEKLRDFLSQLARFDRHKTLP